MNKIKSTFSGDELVETCANVFTRCIAEYHVKDSLNSKMNTPYSHESLEHILHHKCWIDTVQWHLEDEIRTPDILPKYALKIKKTIDSSNQDRTDIVEKIDSYFLTFFSEITPQKGATLNTESPAWAIDRFSILFLKMYHMKEDSERKEISDAHRQKSLGKLSILEEQKEDLGTAISQLLNDIHAGKKYMKVYRQMKMYNDPTLNPVFYSKNK